MNENESHGKDEEILYSLQAESGQRHVRDDKESISDVYEMLLYLLVQEEKKIKPARLRGAFLFRLHAVRLRMISRGLRASSRQCLFFLIVLPTRCKIRMRR